MTGAAVGPHADSTMLAISTSDTRAKSERFIFLLLFLF
jgi:hypothetical protein